MVISLHRNDSVSWAFKRIRLTIEFRKTKTKLITLANHSKCKQRQSLRGENTCEQVMNMNSAAHDKEKNQNQREFILTLN